MRGALAALAAGALIVAAAALADSVFTDPAGDHNEAPDITSVELSETPDALLTVRVAIANFQALPPDSWLNLWFDLDNNPRTGSGGDEANVSYDQSGTLDFFRWNGRELARAAPTGMTATFSAGVFTFTAPKTLLGAAGTFGLLVVAARQDAHSDAVDEDVIAADFAAEQGRLVYTPPGPATFPDPAGDEDAAPDVTTLNVADTADGWIVFRLGLANLTTLPPDRAVVIGIDRDRRPGTGDGGAELSLAWFGERPAVVLQHWDAAGQEWVEAAKPTRARAASANGAVTLAVHRSELGDVARFGFATITLDFTGPNESVFEDENDLEALDYAPERGFWQYALSHKPPLHLVAGTVSARPAQPVHGRPFAIRVPISRSDTLARVGAGQVTCGVRSGLTGQARWIRASGRFRAGFAECVLLVPKGAKGNVLWGQMTVRALHARGTAKFTYEIR